MSSNIAAYAALVAEENEALQGVTDYTRGVGNPNTATAHLIGIHDSERCEDVDGQKCQMCVWADEVEKRHAAEKAAEEERLVLNAS